MTLRKADQLALHDSPLRFCSYEDGYLYYMDASYVLYEYDCAKRKKLYVADLSATARHRSDISAIVKLGGDYYIGFITDGLVSLRERPEWVSRYEVETIGIDAGVFTLFKDKRQQTLWIGTDGQGAFVYYDDSFSIRSYTFDSFTKRISKPVRLLLADPQGALWLATKGDGIVRIRDFRAGAEIDPAKVDYFNTSNSALSNNSVFKLAQSTRGILWIGNDEGIDYYSPATGRIAELREPAGSKPLRYVHGIHQADDHTLWVATVGEGVYKVTLRWREDTPEITQKQGLVHAGGMEAN
ncbi:MAG: hybrid sensor histidine kinase/response regulator, partial [Rikenellaceae bacterium]|nr:hybrid sensor histidine kinase/response regulator [Rikenellaceae bacterium]